MEGEKRFFLYHAQGLKIIELADGMVLGRSRESDYPITDDLVSSRHFKISVRDGNAFLTDMKSQNKTVINGHELTPLRKYLLNEEDKIKVGDQKFIFTTNPEADFISKNAILDASFTSTKSLVLSTGNTQSKIGAFGHLAKSIKSHSDYLGLLKENRQTIKDLEAALQDVEDKMLRLDQAKEEVPVEEQKEKDLASKLTDFHIQSEEKFEQEIQGFDDAISANEDKINEAKKTIEKLQKEIVMFLGKLEEVKVMQEAFIGREAASNKAKELREEIKSLEDEDLKSKRSNIVRDMRKENKKYKEIQESYSSTLNQQNLKKGKLSLDKKMILDKK